MEILEAKINELKASLQEEDQKKVDAEQMPECSKYPFNKYANTIAYLLGKNLISYDDFLQMRGEYYTRNPYISLFELSPRDFGQNYIENSILKLHLELQKPSIDFDPDFKGEYDLCMPVQDEKGIKIEVKAAHVVRNIEGGTLAAKALKKPADEKLNTEGFIMNFQQLKPQCCDVFIWIAVWLDTIDLWILPSSMIIMRDDKVKRLKKGESIIRDVGGKSVIYMGSQHRGGGDDEGQIFVNQMHYSDLQNFKVEEANILAKIKEYGNID